MGMLKPVLFNSGKKGKNILVLGAIHGNEICGPAAINNIINKIINNDITLWSGSVTFIPICNEKAYEQKKRYIDINLNRIVKYHAHPKLYEEKVANELLEYIEKADYVLDVHSMHTEGTPFVFQDYETKNYVDFSLVQNLPYILVGWPKLYNNKDHSACGYAKAMNRVGLTVECGNHNNPKSIVVAEQCIINSLKYLNIIERDLNIQNKKNNSIYVKMDKIFYKRTKGKFVKNWRHLDFVKKGEIIAKYHNNKVKSPMDSYIIMPNPEAKIDDEWFYLGCKLS